MEEFLAGDDQNFKTGVKLNLAEGFQTYIHLSGIFNLEEAKCSNCFQS